MFIKYIEFLKSSGQRFYNDSTLNKSAPSENLFKVESYSFTGVKFISLACKDQELVGEILDSIIGLHFDNPNIQYNYHHCLIRNN